MTDFEKRRFLTKGAQNAALVVGAALPLIALSTTSLLAPSSRRASHAPSALSKRAAQVALAEWWAWGGQYVDGEDTSSPIRQIAEVGAPPAVESDPGFTSRVHTYFKMGVYPESDDWRQFKDTAWSAAFISYCMRMAGAGPAFPYAIGHHRYVGAAVRNTVTGRRDDSLIAFPAQDLAPQVGDLLWRGRKTSDGLNTSWWGLDRIIRHLRDGWEGFPSHCDLVVSVDRRAGRLHAIGGNLADRVLRVQSQLEGDGLLKASGYRVIIRNNIRGVGENGQEA